MGARSSVASRICATASTACTGSSSTTAGSATGASSTSATPTPISASSAAPTSTTAPPENALSIRALAELLVQSFERPPLRDRFPPFAGFRMVESTSYYGDGYQDVQFRKPSIDHAKKLLG